MVSLKALSNTAEQEESLKELVRRQTIEEPRIPFSFSGEFNVSLRDMFYTQNFLAPQEYMLFTGGSKEDFREQQLRVQEDKRALTAPSGVIEHIESFVAGSAGMIIGGLSDPLFVAGMVSLAHPVISPAAMATRFFGASKAGRTLSRIGIASLYGGVTEQARKSAQNLTADIYGIEKDKRHAFIEGTLAFALGEGIIIGAEAGIGAIRKGVSARTSQKVEATGRAEPDINLTFNADPYFVPDETNHAAQMGEIFHTSRMQDVVETFSDNMWKDSEGVIYDGGSIMWQAEQDSAMANIAINSDIIPIANESWKPKRYHYHLELGDNFSDLLSGALKRERDYLEKTSGVITGLEKEYANLETKFPELINDYTTKKSINSDLISSREQSLRTAETVLTSTKEITGLAQETRFLESILEDVLKSTKELEKKPKTEAAIKQKVIEEAPTEKDAKWKVEDVRKELDQRLKQFTTRTKANIEVFQQRIRSLQDHINKLTRSIEKVEAQINALPLDNKNIKLKNSYFRTVDELEALRMKATDHLIKLVEARDAAIARLETDIATRQKAANELITLSQDIEKLGIRAITKRMKETVNFVKSYMKGSSEKLKALQESSEKTLQEYKSSTKGIKKAIVEEQENITKRNFYAIELAIKELDRAKELLDNALSKQEVLKERHIESIGKLLNRMVSVTERIEELTAELESHKPLSIYTMTDVHHREASAAFVNNIIKDIKDASDQISILKPLMDSLLATRDLEHSFRVQLEEPLINAFNKIGKENYKNFSKDVAAQKRVIKKIINELDPEASVVVLQSETEQAIYEAIKETTYRTRELQLTYGFNIGYVEKGYLPVQFKDPHAMVRNGVTKEIFIEELLDGLDWVYMERLEEVPRTLTERSEYLSRVYDEIFNDRQLRSLDYGNPNASEFGRKSGSRAFYYKDLDMMFDHMRRFSDAENILEAITMHTNSVTNSLSKYAVLGASPESAAEAILKAAKQRLPQLPYATTRSEKLFGRIFYRISSLESVLSDFTRAKGYVPQGTIARALEIGSRMLTQSLLGGIGVYGIEDITRTLFASKQARFVMKDVLKTIMPGGAPNKEEALYLGLILDHIRHVIPNETRYTKADRAARTWAEFIHFASGSKFITGRQKMVASLNFHREMGRYIKGSWSSIPAEFRTTLQESGITANTWARLQRLSTTKEVQGVQLWNPADILHVKDRLDRQALLRVQTAMHSHVSKGVIEANKWATTAFLGHVENRGTILSAAAQSMKTFMGAPTSLMYLIMSSESPTATIYKQALFVTISGALMSLVRDISRGEVPDYSSWDARQMSKYVLESYKMGGGFGTLTDVVLLPFLAALSEHPREEVVKSLRSMAVGAQFDRAIQLGADVTDIFVAMFHAENPNLISHASKYIPNLPGLELMANRLLLGSVKEFLHEDTTEFDRKRAKRQARSGRRDIFS